MGVYKIGTEDISLTREAALKTAMPYIEEYAKANDRRIEATDVTIAFARDLDGSRGDSILIYPQWCVSTLFDSSEDDVYGFYVSIWADNGVVASANPQGAIGLNNSVPYDLIYMIIIGVATMVIITTVLFIKKKRNF